MLNPDFERLIKELPLLMERLRFSSCLSETEIESTRQAGIYCFYENGIPLYIGRTKNFRNRHRNHCGESSGENTAAFAFLLTRQATGYLIAAYKKEGGRKALMQNEAFRLEFVRQKERIRRMDVRFLPIDDHNLQHLFELYASLELRTPFNKFHTT